MQAKSKPDSGHARYGVWSARRLGLGVLLPALVTTLVAFIGAAGAAPGLAGRRSLLDGTSPAPLACSDTFVDTFQYAAPPPGDPLLAFIDGVTIGGEDYTSTARGNPGVRIRDFVDPLDPARRPDGVDYSAQGVWHVDDHWGMQTTALYGSGAQAGGARVGGTATRQTQPGDPMWQASGGLVHAVPSSFITSTRFVYQVWLATGDDRCAGTGWPGNGCSSGNIFMSGRNQLDEGIVIAMGAARHWDSGWQAGPLNWQAALWIAEHPWPLLWSVLLRENATVDPVTFHRFTMQGDRADIQLDIDGIWMASNNNFLSQVTRPTTFALNHRYYNIDSTGYTIFRDLSFKWLTRGMVRSIPVPLNMGHVYGRFDATAAGDIEFWVMAPDGSGRQPIQPGDWIPAAFNDTGVTIEAVLQRVNVDDPSPVLLEWRVQTCQQVTPTPTHTGTPRATDTPVPTRTPRPTSTPGAYFQVAPLRPAVHLKADPAMQIPPEPYNQTDWREFDPLWYPLQLHAGLVPFAYVDPALPPPQLCYWSGNWMCVPGRVSLKSYTLTGIEMDGREYLNQRITVDYARPHRFMQWHQAPYAFDGREYVYVNWLAPGGVWPHCAPGARCVNVVGATAGVSYLLYDVSGSIHWDPIPAVGGPYDYAFSNSYRVPLSLWYPRAEP